MAVNSTCPICPCHQLYVICLSLGMMDQWLWEWESERHLEMVPGVLCGMYRKKQPCVAVSGTIASQQDSSLSIGLPGSRMRPASNTDQL